MNHCVYCMYKSIDLSVVFSNIDRAKLFNRKFLGAGLFLFEILFEQANCIYPWQPSGLNEKCM